MFDLLVDEEDGEDREIVLTTPDGVEFARFELSEPVWQALTAMANVEGLPVQVCAEQILTEEIERAVREQRAIEAVLQEAQKAAGRLTPAV